ncbi:hypothetical protein [Pantoea stewartii]|uniref:hypothetical protein n=1 Tax=Pantoea stewartii TaxID=66269 RepID=UPI001131E77A|nr:hypothetical protein [Pantoea stewartii]
MAFISQHVGSGRRNSVTSITVKLGKSGSTTCYVSAKIRNGFRFAELELDEVSKQVRVKCGSESGAKLSGKSGGQFSVGKSFGCKVIPKDRDRTMIPLKLNADGWWYGSYAEHADD